MNGESTETIERLAAEIGAMRVRRAKFSGLATEQDLADDRRLNAIEELLGLPEGAIDLSETVEDDYDETSEEPD